MKANAKTLVFYGILYWAKWHYNAHTVQLMRMQLDAYLGRHLDHEIKPKCAFFVFQVIQLAETKQLQYWRNILITTNVVLYDSRTLHN